MKALMVKSLILLAVTLLVGAVWAGMSVTQAPLTRVDFDHGAAIFQKRCASCHALRSGDSSGMGPSLRRIGAVAVTRSPGQSAEAYLLRSIVDPAADRAAGEQGVMPTDIASGLDATDLLSLVGFLMHQGGEHDWGRLLALKDQAKAPAAKREQRVDLATVETGRRLFLENKCIHCHALRDAPGAELIAPTLLSAGRHDLDYLRESIRSPSKVNPAAYRQWNVWLEDGRTFSGRLLRSTDEAIELLVAGGEGHTLKRIPRDEIMVDDDGKAMLAPSAASTMPDNAAQALSDRQLEQLLGFLRTLK